MNDKKLDDLKQNIRDAQHAAIKAIVQKTFDTIQVLENEKNGLQNKIKILKHDLYDLKDGRLDRILERQEMDSDAKDLSALVIENIDGQKNSSPWYIEYLVKYDMKTGVDKNYKEIKLNNSIAKTNASGSYKLEDGTIKYL